MTALHVLLNHFSFLLIIYISSKRVSWVGVDIVFSILPFVAKRRNSVEGLRRWREVYGSDGVAEVVLFFLIRDRSDPCAIMQSNYITFFFFFLIPIKFKTGIEFCSWREPRSSSWVSYSARESLTMQTTLGCKMHLRPCEKHRMCQLTRQLTFNSHTNSVHDNDLPKGF